jgi:hypothetical protein
LKALKVMIRLTYLFVFLAASLIGCKDDEPKDVRDASIGAYDYRLKYYYIDPATNTLVYTGEKNDTEGVFDVLKVTDGIEVGESGILVFAGTGVTESGNGYTFTIASQKVSDNGKEYLIEGYNGFDVGGAKAHGGFNKSFNSFTAYIQSDGFVYINDVNTPVKIVRELNGSKK